MANYSCPYASGYTLFRKIRPKSMSFLFPTTPARIKLLLTIVGWFMVCLSVIILPISCFVYVHSKAFVDSAVQADGVVTKLVERADHGKNTCYYPVFRFRDLGGEDHEIFSSNGSFPPSYHVGEKVTVFYTRNSPKDAKLNDFYSLWGMPAILGGMGSSNLVLGIVFLFVARPYSRLCR